MTADSMDEIIRWIDKQRKKGKTWESIRLGNKQSAEQLVQFLKNQEEDNDWPVLTIEEWNDIIACQIQKEQERDLLIDSQGASVIACENEHNSLDVPTASDSAWQSYKRSLLEKGFALPTVDLIEDATIKTLRNLSRDTRDSGAIKGLVVGNVQSGKTANMAALMAMAADHGWNMVVVLSGMMNNLRDQTIRRILSDLKGSRLAWTSIREPKAASPYGEKARDLDWSEASNSRYLTVCIKNSTRLKDLLNWLNYDAASKEKIKLLIIDDEADQASVNASTQERSAINSLLIDLVNNRNSKHKESASRALAINYIGYTATPYANVLNEGARDESLYPKDFITALSVSDEYFGPQHIFGYEGDDAEGIPPYPGLDIIRNISDGELTDINDIHAGNSETIPPSLADSIAWFLCGVAAMRLRGYMKPLSMLIHTSRNTDHHDNIYNAVVNWFASKSRTAKIDLCRQLWERESNRFTEKELFYGYPDYGHMAGGRSVIPNPAFDRILPLLTQIIDEGVKNIFVSSNDEHRIYSTGVHLCKDNSRRNDDETTQLRLMYPEDDEMPTLAPAFIVIGGNTLSRGLTLEGLISTFFIRPARCADTLMQMGRWFGYRRGYELLPRIWMPQQTKDQFVFMAQMDQRLRDEIRQMSQIGVSPADCGPKIMASPSTKFLQIVSANKSQEAVAGEYDFSGHTTETGVFSTDIHCLESNMNLTKSFVSSLGIPCDTGANPYSTKNKVWRGVPWITVRDFIEKYKYSKRIKAFADLPRFLEWFDKMTENGNYGDWNIILAGVNGSDGTKRWSVSEDVWINGLYDKMRPKN